MDKITKSKKEAKNKKKLKAAQAKKHCQSI
jgi:hypothetical protein